LLHADGDGLMVAATPTTLVDLRAALRERCQLDTNDPRATNTNLNTIINEAVARFDIADPRGWPWDWLSTTVAVNGATTSPLLFTQSSIAHKIRYVLLGDANGLWQYPLERVGREEQLDRYPLDSQRGVPRTYALMGADVGGQTEPYTALHIAPAPDRPYNLVIGGFRLIPTLVADADPATATNDFQIGDWSPSALEYAAHLVYRAREDLSEAVSALSAFDADVIGMRRFARRTYGAGVPGQPLADDPDLR